jgi:FkbM family methyltransferase
MQKKSFGQNIFKGIQMRWNKLFYNPYRKVNLSPIKKIYYKHLNPDKTRTHQLFGKELSFVSPTELLHGFKEIFVDEIYKQDLPPHPYIIDCGANIGLSVIYLKHQHPDAEILAFEPDDKNFGLLEKNVRSFNLDNVHLRKEAVWIEKTALQFAGEGSMSSRIGDASSQHTVQVDAVRLKDFLNRPVDFLKIDIEGAEYPVLMDIANELRYVNNLFLEYHGSFAQNNELAKLFSLLVENGFAYYIKEATSVYATPFILNKPENIHYDVQLNIFCFRLKKAN